MSQQKANQLASEIRRLADVYHQSDKPIVEDSVYDALVRDFRALLAQGYEVENNPLNEVGAKPKSGFVTIKHLAPMLSLSNSFGVIGLKERLDKIKALLPMAEFSVEYKYDGLALSLIYEYGELVKAVLRGDGETGEVVTANAKTVENIPHGLAYNSRLSKLACIEIRGEVLFRQSDFKQYNLGQEKPASNPRNLAAGSIRHSDPAVCRQRKLSFVPYDVLIHEGDSSFIADQCDKLIQAVNAGFSDEVLLNQIRTMDVDDVLKIYQDTERERVEGLIDYPIDGLVIKVTNLKDYETLGFTATSPNGAFAAKFEPSAAITELEGVSWQTGRTGIMTPVAEVKPVCIQGVWITQCTLHNYQEIRRLGITPHCHVVIERRGDVIPKIVDVACKVGDHPVIAEPTHCESCRSPVEKRLTALSISFHCTGASLCPQQKAAYILHLASRAVFDIKGIGDVAADKIARALDNHPIFMLDTRLWKTDTFAELDKAIGVVNAAHILLAIELLKEITAVQMIMALGIHGVGESTAKALVKHFGQDLRGMALLINAGTEELSKIKDIGPITANRIRAWFKNPNNVHVLGFLMNRFKIKQEEITITPSEYTGQTWVVTGSFGDMTRQEVIAYLENIGIRSANAVTSKTNVLLAGENAGSKLTAAKALNIAIRHELP